MDNAIAVLGTYIALMAVLAIAVEAFISWLKIPGNSPLAGKPSPEEVLKEVTIWIGKDETELQKGRIEALKKALTSVEEIVNKIQGKKTGTSIDNVSIEKIIKELDDDTKRTAKTIARAADIATKYYFLNEKKRRSIIRFLSIIIGIFFAFLFQIDTLEILKDFVTVPQGLPASVVRTIGIILSGLSASAGSSFWHDQSEKLRSIKKTKESVGELMSR